MKRTLGCGVLVFVAGLIAAGGCADLRELNPCRAVTYAFCERYLECNPSGYANVDDCATAQSKAYHSRAGYNADGATACPGSASACIDKIASATCGRAVDAPECGEILSNRISLSAPGASGQTPSGNGSSGSSGSTKVPPNAVPPDAESLPALIDASPSTFEYIAGKLVACAPGFGCRSEDASYGSMNVSGPVAFDRNANAYFIENSNPHYMSPTGKLNSPPPYPVNFVATVTFTTDPGAASVVYAGRSGESTRLYATNGGPLYEIGWLADSSPVTGIARAAEDRVVVSTANATYQCVFESESCTPLSLPTGIVRSGEGTADGNRYLHIANDGTTRLVSGTTPTVYNKAKCRRAVLKNNVVGCLSTSGELFVDERSIATGVVAVALGDSYVYWVTEGGSYYRARL